MSFVCKPCNYVSTHRGDFSKHLATKKHYRNTSAKLDKIFKCDNCIRMFKTYSGLWRHKKTCLEKILIKEKLEEDLLEEEKPLEIQKEELQELKQELLEIKKLMLNMSQQSININSNNNNNNITILNMLNTYCGDAPTMHMFMNNLEVTDEMSLTGAKTSHSNLIANTFIENIKDVPLIERPLHCTDKKRCSYFFKNDEGWTKCRIDETSTNPLYKVFKALHNKIVNILWVLMNKDSQSDTPAKALSNVYGKEDEIDYFEDFMKAARLINDYVLINKLQDSLELNNT